MTTFPELSAAQTAPPERDNDVLARLVVLGREAQTRLDQGDLGPRARKQALREVREGDEARGQLVLANMGLVYKVVNALDSHKTRGIMEDLEQEGALGLIKAIEKFDPEMGYQFSTYATYWVKDAVYSWIHNNSATIRIPRDMRRERAALLKALDNGADLEEACETTEISVARGRMLMDLPQAARFAVGEDGDELEIVDPDSDFSEHIGEQGLDELKDNLERAMAVLLDDDEAQLLRDRFGLETGTSMTLADVAERDGGSRITIRSAEVRALSKLRHPAVYRLVGDFGTGLDLD